MTREKDQDKKVTPTLQQRMVQEGLLGIVSTDELTTKNNAKKKLLETDTPTENDNL